MENDVELMARIIEHTPIGIIILNPDRTIHYANSLAAHLFNAERQLLQGSTIDQFIVDRDGALPWRELWSSVMQGEAQEERVGIARRDSEEITCILTAFYLSGRAGQQNLGALIFRDITHELKIAEQLEKRNVEMAKMNAELIRSNAELRRISELKSNFMSIASHELKTPLTSIKGYSDIIIDSMRDRIDEGVYRMIESINRAADRLHKVINSILDVTRMEQKKLTLRPELFDLKAAAQESIDEVTQFAVKRNIVIEGDFSDRLPEFYGDRGRMVQMFTNLLTNALKFSPDGSPVRVSIAFEEENQIHCRIKDFGIGIDRGEQKRIFDPFYEVGEISKHSTDHTKFMGSGTGLGLSIVKGIVEQHGGRIWVESEGVRKNAFPGSEFHVLLPLHRQADTEDIAKAVSTAADIRTQGGLSGEEKPTILLIDSDREAVEVTRMVLEKAFDIIATPTGEQGLPLAFEYRPSMILVDTMLPGLDGCRICRILRTQDETRMVPIIFLSTATGRSDIEKCFAAGADDYLIKPFKSSELMDKIWRLLLKKKEEASR